MPVKLRSTSNGSVTLDVPATASDFNLTVPAANGVLATLASPAFTGSPAVNGSAIITAGDTATVTPTMLSQKLTRGTSQATTSGSSKDFDTIPSWVKRITMLFADVSLSGNDDILVQVGGSGGIETTGYVSSGTNMFAGGTSTSGFLVKVANSAFAVSGSVTLHNISGNIWVASVAGSTNNATYAAVAGGGSKTLSDVLDRVRVLSSGTNTFDAGSINILYE